MIHEPQTNISCDFDDCWSETYIYGAPHDSTIKAFLKNEGWTVVDGKHYCDEHTKEDIEA